MSVILFNMPFAQLYWPNLGLSLLQGALEDRGIDCELRNPCFSFAERVGLELYDWIAGHFAFVLGGEQIFARDYFGDRIPSTEQFWNDVLLWTEPNLDAQDKADYETVAAAVSGFLDDCMASVDFSKCKVVGFTTSYQQTLPSLCMAKRIKRLHPEIQICFGGAACEGEMGAELFRRFEEIDYVFPGEADLTFPLIVERILDGTVQKQPLPPGVLARWDRNPLKIVDETVLAIPQLDDLPLPDFDDYFMELARTPLRNDIVPFLTFETSRGCWWGEKMQCAFCGLNGHSLEYRCKSPEKAVEELRIMVDRYEVRRICFSDNNFAKHYFDTFLPKLDESGLNLQFEFEMKTNQTRTMVRKMLDAGLHAAQLGIETFSTPILKMIHKGATARQNLQTLKWYTEGRIEVKWNYLYGFPGEDPKEYEKLLELLPNIYHFHPPTAFGRVRVDRFAPFYRDPEKYGIVDLKPFRGFRYIYPFDDRSLRNLAYFHEFGFADNRLLEDYIEPFLEKLRQWETEYSKGTLRAFDREDGVLLLTDTRPIATNFQYRLSGIDRELYKYCDSAKTRDEIIRRFPDIPDPDVKLQYWIDNRIMIRVDDQYFSLSLEVS